MTSNMTQRKVDDLTLYASNARLHSQSQIDMIVSSIRQFGFNAPIVIDEDGTVLAGNGRLLAARKIGLDSVPVLEVLHLSAAEKRAYVLIDNKIAEFSEWDDAILKTELDIIIEDTGDIDLSSTGFDDILASYTQQDDSILEEDNFGAPGIAEPVIKDGDLIYIGLHRLLCADSTKKENIDRLTKDVAIDGVYTDPPYGIKVVDQGRRFVQYGHRAVYGDNNTDIAIATTALLLEYSYEKYVIWGANYFNQVLPNSRCWIAWEKHRGIDRNFCGTELAWTNFDAHTKALEVLWDGWCREGEEAQQPRMHPNQKPILLAKKVFEYGKMGQNILDIFSGSGSTLIACEATKRQAYLLEIDAMYCQLIIERYIAYTSNSGNVKIERDGKLVPYAELKCGD